MFWVADSVRVVGYRPALPISMTIGAWKERKDSMEYLNDRT